LKLRRDGPETCSVGSGDREKASDYPFKGGKTKKKRGE